jgi:hypothetical protein
LAGCTTTQQVKVGEVEGGAGSPTVCPFLGTELCARLTPTETPGRFSGRAEPVMGLRYMNPDAQWTQYEKIRIAPVTFWGADDTSLSQEDQLALANYFTTALNAALSKRFPIVDQAGAGVMDLQVAIDDIGKAVPVLRTVSMIVPQARMLGTLKYVATGTYAFVGSAQAEGKVIDSVSGQVLAAAVDKRVGGGHIETAAQWQLGDAENAITAWSQQIADRLWSWTSGAPAR